ncbi:MAG: transglutaminaseTgpA domain-containing protein [Pseudolysinimonas sp.]|uniref:transglutaminase family protein n=1 Tax=Pseudolysinimonas sp. TaxID=2680009 RepID=UPI003C749133
MSARTFTGRIGADVGIHSLLALIGIVGLATSFDDLGWLLAGAGGLVVGTAAALAAKLLRLGALTTVVLALAAYVLFGSALAVPEQALFGVVPTGTSLTSLVFGAVWGWNDLLTLAAPVDLPDYVTVVPYVSAWLVGLVGATLAARWLPSRPRTSWRAALLLVGPVLLYLASILLGTREPFQPGLRGVVFAAVALVWLGWRQGAADRVHVAGGGMLRRRITGTAVLVGAAVALGTLSGAALVPPPDRFVLRERIEPPYEPLDFASPLAGFRQYSKLLEDEALFTVAGLEPGQRLRLATMDAYDGRIWTVAGAQISSTGSGSFALVGPEIPAPTLVNPAGEQSLQIEILDYADVWIPGVGYAQTLTIPGASRDELQGLRYNAATGSAVITSGLAEGDLVHSTAVLQQTDISDDDLVETPVARVELAPVTVIPDIVASKALEFAGDATSPIEQLRAIELTLQSTGYFSRGTASDTTPSVAGHGADRLSDLLTSTVMVGDEEQYASAFALMARSLGYPARVVMGFAPDVDDDDETVTVTGHDVTAWVEVAFEGVGWIAFSPTPDQTDVPQDQDPKPQTEPQPQVRQPPRSAAEQDDLVTAVDVDDGDSDDPAGLDIPGWLVAVGLALLIPGVLVFGPLLVVARLKAARARRRRFAAEPHESVRGAWDELVDRYSELGLAVPVRATRLRTARVLAGQVGVVGLVPAAERVDAAVFGDAPVGDTMVAVAWNETDDLVRAAYDGVPPRARLLSRYRLSSVRAWLNAASARVELARSRQASRVR